MSFSQKRVLADDSDGGAVFEVYKDDGKVRFDISDKYGNLYFFLEGDEVECLFFWLQKGLEAIDIE